MTKIALIGCGYWGKNIARALNKLGVLAAVVDGDSRTAIAVGSLYGVPAASLEEVLANPEIVGVAIAAPAELHAALASRALLAGKGVFVEKPLALLLEDAEKLRDLANSTGKVLMAGHLLQYHPAFESLLAAVKSGRLGTLRYAYSNRLSLGKFRIEEDVMWSFAPHDLSMLLALFDGEPSSVSATSGAFLTPGIADECRIDMVFPNGAHAHVFSSWLHPFKEHRLVVVGEKAMAVFEDSAAGDRKLLLYAHQIDLSSETPAAEKTEPLPIPYGDAEPLLSECRHFVECIATGATPRTDSVESLRVLRVLAKATTAQKVKP
ncbi:MAG: Gfo/Idh/MocA family oxidoreductase [Caulobacteraceae bacterium]|nr:Gfo/Idh/MocA family oxidoreductase [Caulobacteraceae bacterium]